MRTLHALLTGSSLLLLCACTIGAQMAETGLQSSAEFKLAASSSSSSAEAAPVMPVIATRILSGGILELGRGNAPVAMQLFINHSSPYSRQFVETYLPWLNGDFMKNGDLRISLIPMAFQKYPRSAQDAAMLACATMEGKGLEMNSLLFSQPTEAIMQNQITALGLDAQKIADCVKSEATQTTLGLQSAIAAEHHVTVVPTYFLNGKAFTGFPDYSDLRGQVREARK